MQGNTALIAAYAIIWLGVLAYLGWIAFRMRSVRADVETVRLLVEERREEDSSASGSR